MPFPVEVPNIPGTDILTPSAARNLTKNSAGTGLPFNKIYKVTDNGTDWYKVLPYGFRYVTAQEGNSTTSNTTLYSWLPINPSNLSITTHFATNLTTTLYGIVEEHSEIRYYDVIIQGTTGFSPRYVAPKASPVTGSNDSYPGRQGFTPKPLIPGLPGTGGNEDAAGGFFQQTLSTATVVAQQVKDLLSPDDNESGIPDSKGEFGECSGPVTGYLAFHNLYRLLQLYKRDASGQTFANLKRKHHPLQFINNKDNTVYDVVPVTFTLNRTAESPLLYHYNITMRCFNLRGADTIGSAVEMVDLATALGVGGGTSWMAKASSVAAHGTAAVSGILKLGGGLGG